MPGSMTASPGAAEIAGAVAVVSPALGCRRTSAPCPTWAGNRSTRAFSLWLTTQALAYGWLMYIHFLGSGGHTDLSAGWGNETSLSTLSPTRIDATAPSAEGARLTVISILCTTTVQVAPGSRVELSGGDVLGSHSVDVEPSDLGPVVHVQAIPVLGRIKVTSA